MNDRSSGRRAIISRRQFALVIGLAVVGVLAVAFGRLTLIGYELRRESQDTRDEIAALQTENKALQEQLDYWQSDQGLEELARQELGWARPGETLVVVVPTGGASSAASSPPEPIEGPPNWLRWWRLFAGT